MKPAKDTASSVWDEAIAVARRCKDEFVDNPTSDNYQDASNIAQGMFEIITALEAARDLYAAPALTASEKCVKCGCTTGTDENGWCMSGRPYIANLPDSNKRGICACKCVFPADKEPQHCGHCEGELIWTGSGYRHVDQNTPCIAFKEEPPLPDAVAEEGKQDSSNQSQDLLHSPATVSKDSTLWKWLIVIRDALPRLTNRKAWCDAHLAASDFRSHVYHIPQDVCSACWMESAIAAAKRDVQRDMVAKVREKAAYYESLRDNKAQAGQSDVALLLGNSASTLYTIASELEKE